MQVFDSPLFQTAELVALWLLNECMLRCSSIGSRCSEFIVTYSFVKKILLCAYCIAAAKKLIYQCLIYFVLTISLWPQYNAFILDAIS